MSIRSSVLIIEPDRAAQRRLKQALNSAFDFGDIYIANDFTDVFKVLSKIEVCDIIFISNRLNKHHVSDFIQETKEKLSTRDASNILLLDYTNGDSTSIATRMLEGIDGFLVEPYSVEALQDIAKTAKEVKKAKSSAREKSAIRILVKEIMLQIDHIVELKKMGAPAKISQKVLEEMTGAIRCLESEAIDSYFHILMEEMPKISAQKAQNEKLYAGIEPAC